MSIFVTTDLRLFGRLLPASTNRNDLLNEAYELLRTYTHSDSVWLPAFNYDFLSFGNGRHFPDSISTGALNEFIYKYKSEWKSQDPVFSVVGWGEKPRNFGLNSSTFNSYGRGSIFEDLISSNAKILSFGLGISDGATFMHMVESNRPQGPLYRYWKDFDGVFEIDGNERNLKVSMHCRPLGYELTYDLGRLNDDLIANGIVQVIDPKLKIFIANVSEVYEYWLDRATHDPFYLLTKQVGLNFKRMLAELGREFVKEDFE